MRVRCGGRFSKFGSKVGPRGLNLLCGFAQRRGVPQRRKAGLSIELLLVFLYHLVFPIGELLKNGIERFVVG